MTNEYKISAIGSLYNDGGQIYQMNYEFIKEIAFVYYSNLFVDKHDVHKNAVAKFTIKPKK